MSGRTFWHSGDLGDIIAALPTVRALGGGDFIIGHKPNGQRESLRGPRFEALAPLLLAQPYIASVRWGDPVPGCIDFSDFRHCPHDGMNIAYWQAKYVGAVISMEPWLAVRAPVHGRAVVARSPRYHNPEFPWRTLLPRLVDPLFIGFPDEHDAFCKAVGWRVEHAPTSTLLETARLIAGARVFVGNQSAPFWIAIGLGTPTIQETWLEGANSVVHRKGAHYPHFNSYDLDAALK